MTTAGLIEIEAAELELVEFKIAEIESVLIAAELTENRICRF